jgi:SAM-dependent methyltransferase
MMMGELLPKLKSFKYSVESAGLRRTLMDVASHVLTYRADQDRSFDRRYRTDTAGMVSTSALGIEDPNRRDTAILYLPSPTRVTRWMLDHVDIDHREFSFVDLGCGKGRVILVAAHYPFQRIIGVDISPAMTEIARRNVASFTARSRRCENVEVRHADATTLDFPDTNVLLHLYHPFNGEVTAAVLTRLQESLATNPRRVLVAYLLYSGAVPEVREVFARFTWLRETRYEHSLLGNYDWLFFSN